MNPNPQILVRLVLISSNQYDQNQAISAFETNISSLKELIKLSKFSSLKNGESFCYNFDCNLSNLEKIFEIEQKKGVQVIEQTCDNLSEELKSSFKQDDELISTNRKFLIEQEDLKQKLTSLEKQNKTLLNKLQKSENTNTLSDKIMKSISENMDLSKENAGLSKKLIETLEEQKNISKNLIEVLGKNEDLSKEITKLEKALLFAYDDYGGLTARRVVDKFYDYFAETHSKLGCEHDENLYIDKSKKQINKIEISDHWDKCTKLDSARKNFFLEFSTKIGSLNLYFNKYIHRQKLTEIIVPNNCDYKIIKKIYQIENEVINKELNGNKQENLSLIRVNLYGNAKTQIQNFYHYKMN